MIENNAVVAPHKNKNLQNCTDFSADLLLNIYFCLCVDLPLLTNFNDYFHHMSALEYYIFLIL